MTRVYVTVEEVAQRYRRSVRSIHELTGRNAIPCRKLPGQRRILFLEAELDLWDDGAELEVLETDGGRVVRPRGSR